MFVVNQCLICILRCPKTMNGNKKIGMSTLQKNTEGYIRSTLYKLFLRNHCHQYVLFYTMSTRQPKACVIEKERIGQLSDSGIL